jgi:hypothetical protein
MRKSFSRWAWGLVLGAFALTVMRGAPAWAQQTKASQATQSGPVVRTYGAQGGYRTEVTSQTKGTLSEENRQQVAVLTAQVFQHIDEAQQALDAEDQPRAQNEVSKGRQAIKAIRALLPKTSVRTRTTAPDGSVIYEDEREVQEDWVPLFEGMLHTQTLAPILAAKQEAAKQGAAQKDAAKPEGAEEVTGVRLVGSEAIVTEALANLDFVASQLEKAARALDHNKTEEASKALAEAQVRGVALLYHKEDTPLAEARDAIWLAKRALEENNVAQAQANLNIARQQLRLYREIAPEARRSDVDQMLKEAEQLEAQLQRETAQGPATRAERTRQGNVVTRWWEQVNRWFRRRS